jgi:mono/diheme cytochrome c family protein
MSRTALAAAMGLLLAVVASVDAGPARPQTPASPAVRSVRDGVYTEAQAARGRVTFQDVCSVCHPDPLWRPKWRGMRVGELYRFIARFMPDDNPRSLKTQEAVDVFAYILSANGLPPGAAELPDRYDDLILIRIEEP